MDKCERELRERIQNLFAEMVVSGLLPCQVRDMFLGIIDQVYGEEGD